MTGKTAVVFGAGKIARAFIAHLLTLSGYHITFVERAPALAASLRERGRYKVSILGAPEHDIVISGFRVLEPAEEEAVAAALASAGIVFTAIGGPNLPETAPLLAAGVRRAISDGRREPLNVILCENYFQPGPWLRGMVRDQLSGGEQQWLNAHVGFVESLVLRSSIEPTEEMRAEDPLSLKAQNAWELPVDRDAFVGEPPAIRGLAPKGNFQGGLIRKLFTYNAINAVIAYSGYLRGHRLLSDAANDPEIAALARRAGEESSEALCRHFHFDPEEQGQFAAAALAKYQKTEIVDPIERNARDPLRKLARNDRLVGPAALALEHDIEPRALSQGIAAGLHYDDASDPSAVKLQELIGRAGVEGALREVCGINSAGRLGQMVIARYEHLVRKPEGVS
ncbi:MAG TPA: hypothetical protein VHA11_15695 [Bryobacteraceae bacterium]|nr:hypothetical protein [Bryobacteraceae bacterium]